MTVAIREGGVLLTQKRVVFGQLGLGVIKLKSVHSATDIPTQARAQSSRSSLSPADITPGLARVEMDKGVAIYTVNPIDATLRSQSPVAIFDAGVHARGKNVFLCTMRDDPFVRQARVWIQIMHS